MVIATALVGCFPACGGCEPPVPFGDATATDASGGGPGEGWTLLSTEGSPTARRVHTAVWAGTEMIVWGGSATWAFATGGRYDPATDTWRPTSLAGAPAARAGHAAVWTGTEMIVWGGGDTNSSVFGDGARYSPDTDTWLPMSEVAAPSPRFAHSAVWTGTVMIVWGGWLSTATPSSDDGAIYDPATDAWAAMTLAGAPSPRDRHGAVWTGEEMIVYGGSDPQPQDVGIYDPDTDTWRLASEPLPILGIGFAATATWSGDRMIVTGGDWDPPWEPLQGAAYYPQTDTWEPLPDYGDPLLWYESRTDGSGIWTGTALLVWGGCCWKGDGEDASWFGYDDGAIYRPKDGTWAPIPAAGIEGRFRHTAVWTGTEMIVWGGYGTNGGTVGTGARYRPD